MSLVGLFTDAEPPAWFPKEMRAELRMLREGWEELQAMFYEVWRCMKHLELLWRKGSYAALQEEGGVVTLWWEVEGPRPLCISLTSQNSLF